MSCLHNGFGAAVTVGATATVFLVGGCGSERTTTSPGSSVNTASPMVSATASPTATVMEDGPQPGYDGANFSNPTRISNRWLPLKPGTQFIYEGHTIEDGERTPHRLVSTVTDLTKEIDGVRNGVVWERDYEAGELVEAELAFFAQADDGDIWHFGQYPEEYEEGTVVASPTWVHGLKGAQAGITIKADYKLSDPSHAQGWGPQVGWTDRAKVHQVGQRTCVPAGCYDDVLVVAESSREEIGAVQYKYYAPGVGNVRVGYGGKDPTRETLQLVKVVQCTPQEIAKARTEALKLEKSAYQRSKGRLRSHGAVAASVCSAAVLMRPGNDAG
jgi:hypothetical protein